MASNTSQNIAMNDKEVYKLVKRGYRIYSGDLDVPALCISYRASNITCPADKRGGVCNRVHYVKHMKRVYCKHSMEECREYWKDAPCLCPYWHGKKLKMIT